MNFYGALLGNKDSPIGKFTWGNMVLSSVNLHLTDVDKLDIGSTCQAVLDKVLLMEPATRKAFLDMDIPVAVGEEIEQYRASMRGRVMIGLSAFGFVAVICLAAFYINATANSEKGVDNNTLSTILQIIPAIGGWLNGGQPPAQ